MYEQSPWWLLFYLCNSLIATLFSYLCIVTDVNSKTDLFMSCKSIKDIFAKKKKYFKGNIEEMYSAYNAEKHTNSDYNGRQLLELIQNCDDAGADKVTIRLDTRSGTISICNSGPSPFSEEGYRSICTPYNSPKVDVANFIGNKVLGFRSIINWSEEIQIVSGGVTVTFSRKLAKEFFETNFPEEDRKKMLLDKKLKPDVVPVPFLCTPLVNESANQEFTTIITVRYNKNNSIEQEITTQLDALKEEILLFLKYVNEIDIDIDGVVRSIVCERCSDGVSLGGKPWTVFQKNGELSDEVAELDDRLDANRYEIKIALPEGELEPPTTVYSFFPTNEKLYQPFILHSTFSLDISRNHIVESKANRELVGIIAEFIGKTALGICDKNKGVTTWAAYKLLNVTESLSGDLNKLGYYDEIARYRDELAIYPCVDGSYRKLCECCYASDKISRLVLDNNLCDLFPNMLMPDDTIHFDRLSAAGVHFEEHIAELNQRLNELDREKSIALRSQWIKEINDLKNSGKFPLLIDSEGNVIDCDKKVYTPATQAGVIIPSFCKLVLMNPDLYKRLRMDMEITDLNPSRTLAGELKIGYDKIRGYEPAQLVYSIIGQSNELLQNSPNKKEILQETLKALYNNYGLISTPNPVDFTQTIILLPNKNGMFTKAKSLVFSDSYTKGQLTKDVLGNYYKSDNYIDDIPNLIDISTWGDRYDKDKFEDFLGWLGVNRFANLIDIKIDPKGKESRLVSIENAGFTSATVCIYENYESIFEKISLAQLLIWINNDAWLRSRVEISQPDSSCDEIRSFERNHITTKKCNAIKTFLQNKYKLSDYILDEKYTWSNSVKLENIFKDELVKKYKLSNAQIVGFLRNLGAKDRISDVSFEKVCDILSRLPEQYPDGRRTQSIYEDILSYLKSKERVISGPVKLFADDGKRLVATINQNVYFSEKIKLPAGVKSLYPVFYFPMRAGGAEAIKYFNIKKLEDLQLDIVEKEPNLRLNSEFEKIFKMLKPLILTVRLQGVKSEELIKRAADLLDNIKISLWDKVSYRVNNQTQVHNLANGEYLKIDDGYYTKVTSFGDGLFYTAISDILSSLFDTITNKSDIRLLFSLPYKEAEDYVKVEFGEDNLSSSKRLLMSAKERFISNIAKITQREIDDIKESIGDIDFLDNKCDCSNYINSLNKCFSRLSITLDDYNKCEDLGVYQININNGSNYIRLNFGHIKSALWQKHFNTKVGLLDSIAAARDGIDPFVKDNISPNHFDFSQEELFMSYCQSLDLDDCSCDNWQEKEGLFGLNSNKIGSQSDKLSIADKSKLYYSLTPEEISQIRDDNQVANDDKQAIELQSISSITEITFNNNSFLNSREFNPRTKACGAYNASRGERSKQHSGKSAEGAVCQYLLKHTDKFSSVDYVSKTDDSNHYDIGYVDIATQTYKYVEVKSFNQGFFELTYSELELGRSKRDNYEIWLVKADGIHVLKNLFDESGQFIYQLTPASYRFYGDVFNVEICGDLK